MPSHFVGIYAIYTHIHLHYPTPSHTIPHYPTLSHTIPHYPTLSYTKTLNIWLCRPKPAPKQRRACPQHRPRVSPGFPITVCVILNPSKITSPTFTQASQSQFVWFFPSPSPAFPSLPQPSPALLLLPDFQSCPRYNPNFSKKIPKVLLQNPQSHL